VWLPAKVRALTSEKRRLPKQLSEARTTSQLSGRWTQSLRLRHISAGVIMTQLGNNKRRGLNIGSDVRKASPKHFFATKSFMLSRRLTQEMSRRFKTNTWRRILRRTRRYRCLPHVCILLRSCKRTIGSMTACNVRVFKKDPALKQGTESAQGQARGGSATDFLPASKLRWCVT